MLILRPDFMIKWYGKDCFAEVLALQGEIYREQPGRRTIRFTHAEKNYFAKIHTGVGWKEIFKNLIQFRWPILGAQNEWQAIQLLKRLHIPTMNLVGYGSRGRNPAHRQSFVITEELLHTQSLEDFCKPWREAKPPFRLKRALLNAVATLAKRMHDHGMNHRDFYLCHFLLDLSMSKENLTADNIHLYLIDLHRAQLRHKTPQRWRIKDISGLYFSSMEIGLTRTDLYYFMKIYTGRSLRNIFTKEKTFWKKVQKRAVMLFDKENKNKL